jgi:hypothetical protein
MTEFTFKFKQSNGSTIELSIEDAKQLYQNLHELFGINSVPQYPIYPVYPDFSPSIPSLPVYPDFNSPYPNLGVVYC